MLVSPKSGSGKKYSAAEIMKKIQAAFATDRAYFDQERKIGSYAEG
jgi:hypothetical protein